MWHLRWTVVVVVLSALAAVAHWATREIDISPLVPATGRTAHDVGPVLHADHAPLREAANYAEIMNRPLFAATRRPPAMKSQREQAKPAAVPSPPRNYHLLGVLLRPKLRRALIGAPNEPGGRWIDEGGNLDGGQLKRVTADKVTLVFGDATIVLRLERR